MNQKYKRLLQAAFEPPRPMKKEAFLQKLNYPKTRYRDFLISQLGYIQKRVWVFAALLVLAGWFLEFSGVWEAAVADVGLVWIVCALLPFLALLSVTELSRSAFHHMEELEMSCRYSLFDIVAARATILGVGNFLIFAALLIIFGGSVDCGLLRLSVYLIVPYLLTCVGSLLVLRRARGKEGVYGCGAIAGLVGVCAGVFSREMQFYSEHFLPVWIALCVVCVIALTLQLGGMMKRTEEFQWSLSLTD